MTGVIATIPRNQFFDALGKPLKGGKLYTYLAGSTTPAATFQDQDLTAKNENPIPLDATGSCTIWLDPAKSYKFVLKDSKGVTQPGWPVDNVSGAGSLSERLRLSLGAAGGAALIGYGAGTVADALDLLREIRISKMPGATADDKFAAALTKMKADSSKRIVVDGNFDLQNSYLIDYFVHIEGALGVTSLSYHGTGTFLTLRGDSVEGSILRGLSINGNDGAGNFFNGKTLLKLRSIDPNDTGTSPINVTVDHVRFEWCDVAMSLEAAVSCTFKDIRIEHATYGINLIGVCLENSFERVNALCARHANLYQRYTGSAAGSSGDVPQGNYWTNCTLVLQYSDDLRNKGGYTDAAIASTCATIKANCAFDYRYTNCWIENNLHHSTVTSARLGFIVDFVQSYPKSYIGAFGFSNCNISGNKMRFSGGDATSYGQSGMTGTMVVDNYIQFYADDAGAAGLYVGDYLSDVVIRGNNIVSLSSTGNMVTLYHLRNSVFSDNLVLYEDNVHNAWPSAASAALAYPLIVGSCTSVKVKGNDFDYLTATNQDFLQLQGTNTDVVVKGNDCPLSGKVTIIGPVKIIREQERARAVLRTNTESYSNGSTIAALPGFLQIKNPNALDIANSIEGILTGDNCDANHRRWAYQDGVLKFISNGVVVSVNYLRGELSWPIF